MKNKRLEEDMMPKFPSDGIVCKTCKLKKDGIIGFKNAYCKEYVDEPKPSEILYYGAGCAYYEGE